MNLPPPPIPVQSVSDKATEVSLYCISSLTLILTVANFYFAIRNYIGGSKRQRIFNGMLILLSILFLSTPSQDIALTRYIHDGLPNHNQYMALNWFFYPELKDWGSVLFRKLNGSLCLFTIILNYHVSMFYMNFRNIRVIRPFSYVWDFVLAGYLITSSIFFIATLLFLEVFMRVGFFVILLILWICLFINAIIFHFCAIFFLMVLFRHNRKSLHTSQLSITSEAEGSFYASNPVRSENSEADTSRRIYRTLLFFGIAFWFNLILFVVGFNFPFVFAQHTNLGQIIFRSSTFFHPLELSFTIRFIISVRKLIRLWSPVQIDEEVYLDMFKNSNRSRSRETSVPSGSSTRNPPQYETGMLPLAIPSLSFSANSPIRSFIDRNPRRLSTASAIELTINSLDTETMHHQELPLTGETSIEDISYSGYDSEEKYTRRFLTRLPLTSLTTTQANNIPDNGELSSAGTTLVVSVPFLHPSRPDEIVLRNGDRVSIDVTFRDGWALGFNHATRQRGYFPLNSCPSFGLQMDDKMKANPAFSPFCAPVSHLGECVLPRATSLRIRTNSLSIPSSDSSIMTKTDENKGKLPDCSTPHLLLRSRVYAAPVLPVPDFFDPPAYSSVQRTTELDATTPAAVGSPATPSGSNLLVILTYSPKRDDELQLIPGDQLHLIDAYDDGWGYGVTEDGVKGVFPLNYCVVLAGKGSIH